MRNNSLAMLATVAGVGVLAWWIGFFDPETCPENTQTPGWTSCESIANQQGIALWVFISVFIVAVAITSISAWRKRKK